MKSKSGFTLIEMLVVIGIIATLMGVAIASYSRLTRSAERTKVQELVNNVATALTVLYQKEGSWPRRLASVGGTDGRLDENASLAFVDKNYDKYNLLGLNVSRSGNTRKLIGLDRFGIVTPWATAVIKRMGSSASLTTPVGSAKIQDHILHFAIDLDGDGIIKGASVGGSSVDVRATAIVWCCGKDGVISPYSNGKTSKQCDDVYSWSVGQTKEVK